MRLKLGFDADLATPLRGAGSVFVIGALVAPSSMSRMSWSPIGWVRAAVWPVQLCLVLGHSAGGPVKPRSAELEPTLHPAVSRTLSGPQSPPLRRLGLADSGLRQQWRKARNSSLSEYQRHLAQTEALRDRLLSSELRPDHWVVGLLNDKANHLRSRIAIRERRRVARAAMVAQELLKGHYHRYTLGLRSAFKDIAS